MTTLKNTGKKQVRINQKCSTLYFKFLVKISNFKQKSINSSAAIIIMFNIITHTVKTMRVSVLPL